MPDGRKRVPPPTMEVPLEIVVLMCFLYVAHTLGLRAIQVSHDNVMARGMVDVLVKAVDKVPVGDIYRACTGNTNAAPVDG